MADFYGVDFPSQRVSASERNKPEWYANCCDYVIAAGLSARNQADNDIRYGILHENIPEEFYKKTLNPYNSQIEKYTRFPATMRNYDIMKPIIRRYVGEYIKNPHEFIVTANNPEVMMGRDAKLGQEIMRRAEEALAQRIQQSYQEFVQGGNNPEEFDVNQQLDIEGFVEEFKQNYVDEVSAQGAEILQVIDNITDSLALYSQAYAEFVSFGECYTYSDVRGDQLIKKVVSVRDAFPVPNDSKYVEDFDMFAERMMMTKQQIIDNFADYLSKKDIDYIDDYYRYATGAETDKGALTWDYFKGLYYDVCGKFTKNEVIKLENRNLARELSGNLFPVWHVVWRGEVKQGILTYSDGAFVTQRIVDEDYQFNPATGDIDLEWVWKPQVFESVRIGSREYGIYPYKARAIAYNRGGKLPYNGLVEFLPGFGKFSIIDTVLPYQIFRNIIMYHRELTIAKNKMNILIMAKSLLGKYPEDTIYKMAADGVLYVDDDDDAGMVKANAVRVLQAGVNDYIIQLGQIADEAKQAAMEAVDMTPQRYGEIANSAGKGVTQEAVMRGSMGSVIIEYMFDIMREHDYQRDMDYTKLAWIDGLRTSYRIADGNIGYLSLDVNSHIYANYLITCKNSIKEREKLNQFKELAFSAAQNGDLQSAAAAIDGENIAQIKKLIDKFADAQRQHESEMEQMKQQAQQMLQEFELRKIAAKGEEDRKTLELEKYLDSQIEMIRVNGNIMSYDNGLSEVEKNQAEERMLNAKNQMEREKIQADRDKHAQEMAIKEKEIAAKIYDSDNKVKIAKTNKNRYDK